jgi:DNA-directed RNA polymerase specialized sigma24 family protein
MADQERSSEAFKDLFFRYYPSFFTFSQSLVYDKTSAQNLTTEALVILWMKRADLAGDVNRRAFLYNIIRNNALAYLKYLQRIPESGPYKPEKHFDPALPDHILQEILDYVARVM